MSTVSVDFFTVPTIRFQNLYVFLVLAHDQRGILDFGVTAHPTDFQHRSGWQSSGLRQDRGKLADGTPKREELRCRHKVLLDTALAFRDIFRVS
jgi:hypothetical protein